jgi:acyl-CoA dehydrogenase
VRHRWTSTCPPSWSPSWRGSTTSSRSEIKPLQAQDDNERFFDHRREWARTDFDNGGLPRPEWEALLAEASDVADKAGFYRFSAQGIRRPGRRQPVDGVIRDHLAAKGLGLFNDLQNEHSVVGNFPIVVMLRDFGTAAQKDKFIPARSTASHPHHLRPDRARHGSDATHMDTTAVRETRDGVDGWLHQRREDVDHRHAHGHPLRVFAAPAASAGDAKGITCFLVPADTAGREDRGIPVDLQHAHRPPARELHRTCGCPRARASVTKAGLALAQSFVHENRIRQAASSLGAAHFCVQRACAMRVNASPSARRWPQPGHPVPAGGAGHAGARCCAC